MVLVVFTELEVTKVKNKKMDQEYSFALRPASIEEVGLFYSNDEQDEALGTVGHLRLDFGHGFLPLRSTCYRGAPHRLGLQAGAGAPGTQRREGQEPVPAPADETSARP